MPGYEYVINKNAPELGGNMWQGDPWTFSPRVWRYIIDRFAAESILDVGSGRGYAAQWFHKAGCKVVAMDAEIINVKNALFPTVLHNIMHSSFFCPVDVVHCQEVAEHIPEAFVQSFLDTLCNGKFIVMSHAEPGQDGHSHINCQPSKYWIEHIESKHYSLLIDDTTRVKKIAESEGAFHLARSGLVFGRKM